MNDTSMRTHIQKNIVVKAEEYSAQTIAKQWENKIQDVTIEYVEASNFERICQFDAYLFVEEFGKTRYVDFEKKLQELHNFDKTIIGVAVFPL